MTAGKLASELIPGRVKELRASRRLRQADLAARLTELGGMGWSQAKVAKLEGGNRTVTVDDLLLLAAALGVSPLTLFAVAPVRITNKLVVDPYDDWLWARGYKPLSEQDAWGYFSELPEQDRNKIDLAALLGTALSAEHDRRGGGDVGE
jgi:transcriptional regulator with XRE-family HTH domain